MSLLHNKTATVYTYARNANMVSTYTAGSNFSCNIQPVSVNDWYSGEMVYKMKKMFTEYDWLKVGDKLVIETVSYVIKEFQSRDGTHWKYYKAFIQKSEWT